MENTNIIVKGAYTNYLKHLDINIPINKFSCFTGVSGCGKSSLVYDTLYAESQRAIFDGLGGNIFENKIMDKPQVDEILNLRPAIVLSQSYNNNNPRSTIGTFTEIIHYLRNLFSIFAIEYYDQLIPANEFSSSVASGCCPRCNGLGTVYEVDVEKIIPDKNKTLKDGAILYYAGASNSLNVKTLIAICEYYGIDINTQYNKLTNNQRNILLYQNEPAILKIRYKNSTGKIKSQTRYVKGIIPEITDQLQSADAIQNSSYIDYFSIKSCPVCHKKRYAERILNIKFDKKNIADLEEVTIQKLIIIMEEWLHKLERSVYSEQYKQLILQIISKLECLNQLNLEYLTLARSIPSLSGGEIQRVRISKQLDCKLSGLLYILDEPCRGLHFRNIDMILNATKGFISKGNTVISIEHNPLYIENSDQIFELGPQGGKNGGYLINVRNGTGKYELRFNFSVPRNKVKNIELHNVNYHNICNQDFTIPEKVITCITGVSGSGKSSLVKVLHSCISQQSPQYCEKFTTTLKKSFYVNQQPIGKNGRSTIVTYLAVFNDIRELFSEVDDAQKNGIVAADFSFNIDGGRCNCCLGTGYKKIEMSYLPDSYIVCPECEGKRFSEKVLQIKYKGLSINDVLSKPIEEIIDLFKEKKSLHSKLQCMVDIGLGYLALGNLTAKLSGGESQRVKLAKELGRTSTTNTLFILDEPSAGLHRKDIKKIKEIIERIADKGNTIVLVEHNLEFISEIADAILDFGNKSGNDGGRAILFINPREAFKNSKSSLYGFLN